MAGQTPCSKQLLQEQLLLYGKIARAQDTDLPRSLTFCKGTMHPVASLFVVKVEHPRNEWAGMLGKEASKLPTGSLWNAKAWTEAVRQHCAARCTA